MIRRYSSKKLEKIFSDKSRYENWLKIELVFLKYLSKNNLFSEAEYHNLASDLIIFEKKIREEEKRINHDVAAFVNFISEISSSPLKKWIHYGLTSSDLVDTSNSMMLREANKEIVSISKMLIDRIRKLALKHSTSYCLNRKNGKINGITSFGYILAYYYEELRKSLDSFESYRQHVECASVSGSLGICPYVGVSLQEFMSIELDLYSSKASTQVLSRDRYFKYFNLLGCLVNSVNRLALELRNLSRTEIKEVSESFSQYQVGSSSMPHKRNPIALENVCGLSRLFNAYASASSKNIEIWLERDISHSSVDRILFLDAITSAYQVLYRMHEILKHIFVDTNTMLQNIEKHDWAAYQDIVRQTLLKSGREEREIDKWISEVKHISLSKNVSFKEAFKSTNLPDFIGSITPDILFSPAFSMNYLLKSFRQIFAFHERHKKLDNFFYDKHEIENAISKMALKLNYLYRNESKPVQIIGLRESSIMFMSRLVFKLNFPITIKTFNLANKDSIVLDKKFMNDRRVLVLDALIRNSKDIEWFKDFLKRFKVRDVKLASLFFLSDSETASDFRGLFIPDDKFLVGFGLSVNGFKSHYSEVGKLKEEYI